MKQISTADLREKYLQFFESRGHIRIPSAPLVPENDPSVLFTTAGMHPLVPYLKGQPHPAGTRLTNVQKCLRTTDIDAVGDATHATVFEMLGNWSLGDYFKREAIHYSWDFLTSPDWLGLDRHYLAVSVFAGDDDAPRDSESAELWQQAGVAKDRIAFLDKAENWWPAGGGAPGPQGPDTEIFYWVGDTEPPDIFDPQNSLWVEIWNDVFMQYNRTPGGSYAPLPQQNVDTGMGLERVVMVLNGQTSIYEIDTYRPLVKLITSSAKNLNTRQIRILADHIKAATFMLGDEHPVVPGKSEQGYVLRRVLRRAVNAARRLGYAEPTEIMSSGMHLVIEQYRDTYPTLQTHAAQAAAEMKAEIAAFNKVLTSGLALFEKVREGLAKGDVLSGRDAFVLYTTHGFPIELTQELATEHGLGVDMGGFEAALQGHQSASRLAGKGKFKGGLADHSAQSTKYHTATHLLHQALRTVLGDHARQRGSNITPERLRFDFTHQEKLTDQEQQAVTALVNQKIREDLPVTREEMTVAEAKKRGALGLFEDTYGERVSVYSIGDFSAEICGGPHVNRTGELGTFEIIKEESAGAGVRRIKAVLK